MNDGPFDLERFRTAQDPVYEDVLGELAAGRKTSHWMWFIFPQLKVLGRSNTAKFFGIENEAEAAAYWREPVLGARLQECTERVLQVRDRSIHSIFGSPDDLKLRSCMTLFERVAPQERRFGQVLERYYGGVRDPATLAASQSPDRPPAGGEVHR